MPTWFGWLLGCARPAALGWFYTHAAGASSSRAAAGASSRTGWILCNCNLTRERGYSSSSSLEANYLFSPRMDSVDFAEAPCFHTALSLSKRIKQKKTSGIQECGIHCETAFTCSAVPKSSVKQGYSDLTDD